MITESTWRGERDDLSQSILLEALSVLQEGYARGRFLVPPSEMRQRLGEVDPALLDDTLWRMGWQQVGSGSSSNLEAERQYTVESSKRLWRRSPLGQWIVLLWTSWGLGDRVTVTTVDESAQEDWDEFWTSGRNASILGDDNLHYLSDWTVVDGNRFLVYFTSDATGETTIKSISPDEIKTIVTDPEDDSEPWFYRREYTTPGSHGAHALYYPSWNLLMTHDDPTAALNYVAECWDELIAAGDVDPSEDRVNDIQNVELGRGEGARTVVCVQHVNHNRKDETSLWGWPIMMGWYIEAHKSYVESRLNVAAMVNRFVRRYQVQGGSRAVEQMVATIASNLSSSQYTETNPPPVAGSSEVLNRAVEVEDLPMRTGASDAKADHEMFAWMALLGSGVFPTSAGLDTARWATAVEMDKAQSTMFTRYQTFWSAQFKRMAQIVLTFREWYGGRSYASLDAQVSIDSFSLPDFPGITSAIGNLAVRLLKPLVEQNVLPKSAVAKIAGALLRPCLQALGVENIDELVNEDALEPEEEPAPPSQLTLSVPGRSEGEGPPGPPELEAEEEAPVAQVAAAVRAAVAQGIITESDAELWSLGTLLDLMEGEGNEG